MAVVGTSIKEQQSQKFLCDACAVSFASKWSYDRHLKKFHAGLEIISGPKNITCGLCEDKVRNMTELHKHIQNTHPEVPLEFYTKEFYSMDDFKIWKKQFELATLTCFTKRNGSKNLHGGTLRKEIYYCTRSGIGKIIDESSRKRRSLTGSVRTGITCPSVMRVTIDEVEDLVQITVSIQTTHIGHELEIEKLRLTGEHRKKLADLLAECGSFANAMSKFQIELGPSQLSGVIKRQHLYNVKRDFKINGIKSNIGLKRGASISTKKRNKRKLIVGNSCIAQPKTILEKPNKKFLVDKSSVFKSFNGFAKSVSPSKQNVIECRLGTNVKAVGKQNSAVKTDKRSDLEPMHGLEKQDGFLVDKSSVLGQIKVLAKPVSPSKQSANELEMDTSMSVLAKQDNSVVLEDNRFILDQITVLGKHLSPLKQNVIELKLDNDLNGFDMYEVNVENTEETLATDVWSSFRKLMTKVNTKEQLEMISLTLSKCHSEIDLCGQI